MGRVFEAVWDCSYCGTRGIRGSVRECPNCSRARDVNVKFYPPDKKNYLSESEAEKVRTRGPDWVCEFCDSLNSDLDKKCKSCGSTRGAKNPNYHDNQRKKDSNYSEVVSTTPTLVGTSYSPPAGTSSEKRTSRRGYVADILADEGRFVPHETLEERIRRQRAAGMTDVPLHERRYRQRLAEYERNGGFSSRYKTSSVQPITPSSPVHEEETPKYEPQETEYSVDSEELVEESLVDEDPLDEFFEEQEPKWKKVPKEYAAKLSSKFSKVKNSFGGNGKSGPPWYERIDPMYFKFTAGILIACLLIYGIVYLFTPKEVPIEITALYWERNIQVEEYRTVEENDWSIPQGGRLLYTNREIHHYDHVIDHYETKTRQVPKERYVRTETYFTGYRDLGNGYMEEITSSRDIYETYYETETYQEAVYRDDPVYATKYYYEIERWVYDRTVTSSGGNHDTYWPDTELAENERDGSKSEKYQISGFDTDDDEKTIKTYTLTYNEWSLLKIGMVAKFKITPLGSAELIIDENMKPAETYNYEAA